MMTAIILIANLLAARLSAQAPQPCVPPLDGVVYCPQNFYPSVRTRPSPAQRTQILKELDRALVAASQEKTADDAWKNARKYSSRFAAANHMPKMSGLQRKTTFKMNWTPYAGKRPA